MLLLKNTRKTSAGNYPIAKPKKKGFTSLELILVLGLLMILSLIGFQYRHLAGFRSDAVVRTFASDIRYVYHKTRYNDWETAIRYLFDQSAASPRNRITGYCIVENNVILRIVDLPSSLQVRSENGLSRLTFSRKGTFQGSGETLVFNDEASGNIYKITIVPFSGRVEVYKDE